MKGLVLFFVLLTMLKSFATNVPVNGKLLSPKTYNFFVHLPEGYDENNSAGYPVLFFLHGKGERGQASYQDANNVWQLDMNILNTVLKHGPPLLIKNGTWDNSLPFIVVSPQSTTTTGGFNGSTIKPIYDYIVSSYNVNTNKVYSTGLSQGGNSTYNFLRDYPELLAAIIPVAAWAPTLDCSKINHVAVWGFHGDADTTVGYGSGKGAINQVNNCNTINRAKLTSYAGVTHNSWTRTYNLSMSNSYNHEDASDDATKNIGADGQSYHDIYKWLLTFSLDNSTPPPAPNQAPSVNAGADQEITLPATSISLSASASDSDGTISSVLWTQISGPSILLSGEDTNIITLSNLVEGNYVFNFTATDDQGASSTDSVSLLINPDSTTTPPTTSGSYIEVGTTAWGHIYFPYFGGAANANETRISIGARDTVEFSIKITQGSATVDGLYIGLMMGYATREVIIGNYITSVGSDWVTVSIPLAEFNFPADKLAQGLYLFKFRALGSFGGSHFAFDEVKLIGGGESELVLYGDSHEDSASETAVSASTEYIFVNERATLGGVGSTPVIEEEPPVTSTSGSYIEVGTTAWGHIYFPYFGGAANANETRISIGARDTVEFSIKITQGSATVDGLYIGLMMGYATREVIIGNYITSVGSDWVTVSIPLAEFNFPADKLAQGLYLFKFRALGSFGGSHFAFDEVKLIGGGESELVLYGDSHEDSASETAVSASTEYIFVNERATLGGSL